MGQHIWGRDLITLLYTKYGSNSSSTDANPQTKIESLSLSNSQSKYPVCFPRSLVEDKGTKLDRLTPRRISGRRRIYECCVWGEYGDAAILNGIEATPPSACGSSASTSTKLIPFDQDTLLGRQSTHILPTVSRIVVYTECLPIPVRIFAFESVLDATSYFTVSYI